MKKQFTQFCLAAMLLTGAVACGNKKDDKAHQETTYTAPETPHQDPAANQPAPEISGDVELQQKMTEIVKDFDGVQATVHNGEVTLMGKISRDRLPKLMQSVNALHPKKVNRSLTVN